MEGGFTSACGFTMSTWKDSSWSVPVSGCRLENSGCWVDSRLLLMLVGPSSRVASFLVAASYRALLDLATEMRDWR